MGQLQNRIAELEEKLGEAMADGARYHCQLVQTRQSLFDTQAQLQEVQDKPGLTVKGRQVSDDSNKDFDGPQDESSAMRSLESRGDAATILEEASAEVEAQDERIDEVQPDGGATCRGRESDQRSTGPAACTGCSSCR